MSTLVLMLLGALVGCELGTVGVLDDLSSPVQVPAGWTLLYPPQQVLHAPGSPGGVSPGTSQPGGAPQPGLGGARRGAAPSHPWTYTGGGALEPLRVWVEAFSIDRVEVRRVDYQRFLRSTGYRPPFVDEDWARPGGRWGQFNWDGTSYPPGTGDHPVVLVSWADATAYCRWVGGRLPTEPEWQLAALGPIDDQDRSRPYPWGDTYDGSLLNHGRMADDNTDDSDGWLTTSPVGRFPDGASPYGLLDAFGNAWEFTADFRRDSWDQTRNTPMPGGAVRGFSAPGPGLYVAVRGGSYFFDVSMNAAGERDQFLVELRRKTSGFRCAYDAPR